MRILRTAFIGVAVVAAGGYLAAMNARAQGTTAGQGMSMQGMDKMARPMDKGMAMAPAMTKAQKIASAVSAAPSSISAKATILDWPEKDGMAPAVLRAGTNGWTCFPDMPNTKGNDPACMDKAWMQWADAYMSHTAPHVSSIGIAYMLGPGGGEGSNTDPFATSATATNHWGHHPPHMMILTPDLKSLEGVSTDPMNGGPYVMFAGTPYAHIMAPLQGPTMGGQMSSMKK